MADVREVHKHSALVLLAATAGLMVLMSRPQPAGAKARQHFNFTWPAKKAAEVEGDVILGGLMMVHEREDQITCGPIMPQGGIQVTVESHV